jgi:hypothetical protein
MRRSIVAATVSLTMSVGFLATAPSPSAAQHLDPDYEAVLDQLFALSPRADRVAPVDGFSFTRDAATFTLDSGTLHLLTPVAGRTIGAVFVGEGRVSILPPMEVERAQIRRVFETHSDTLTRSFEALVIIFADSSADELERRLVFGPGATAGKADDRVDDALEYLGNRKRHSFHRDVLTALLNRWRTNLFYAHAETDDGPLFFVVNPYDTHETITIGRRSREARGDVMEPVSEFPCAMELGQQVRLEPRLIAVDHYAIETEIENDLDGRGHTALTFHALRRGVQWIPLRLMHDMDIDSVRGADGTPLSFVRPDESALIWVRTNALLESGESHTVTVWYHGRLLERRSLLPLDVQARMQLGPVHDRWMFLRDPNWWYVSYRWEPAPMDLVFRTPSKYILATVGDSTGVDVEDDVTTTRWRAAAPTRASFMIGEFERLDVNDPRIPPVTVLVNERAHRALEDFLIRNGLFLPRQRDMLDDVSADVANSLSFFTGDLGAPISQRYYAAEIPYSHGQAFPGLLHLSWRTFQSTEDEGGEEMFRAHEMAHQWWGIDVEPATYRDHWISEGLAEFWGLLYMQLALGDNEKYFRVLRDWRDDLHRRRNDIGPTCIGARAAVGGDPGDYTLAIYVKGAWVVHMLRNLFLDMDTMSEEPFLAMMKEFYQTHRGGKASTQDFQRLVEKYVGSSMGWFFDQWLCGTAVPTYRFRHAVDEHADGTYTLRLRVWQDDVPDGFKMVVPVYVDFGEVGTAAVPIFIDKPEQDFAFDQLPAKPLRVELNYLESVLAKVKDEGELS